MNSLDISVDAAVCEVEGVLSTLGAGVVVVGHGAPLGYQGTGGAGGTLKVVLDRVCNTAFIILIQPLLY